MDKFLRKNGFTQNAKDHWEKWCDIDGVTWRIVFALDKDKVWYIHIDGEPKGSVTLFRKELEAILPLLNFRWR